MGKLFGVVVTLIALASAAIFALHVWWLPPDISTHGARIDRQLNETMVVAGVLFVLAPKSRRSRSAASQRPRNGWMCWR